MREKIKSLIMVNSISVISLGLLIWIFFGVNMALGAIAMLFWMIYVIYSNYMLLLHKEDPKKSLREKDKHHLFTREIQILTTQMASLESRADMMDDPETADIVKETYEKIKDQLYYNVEVAEKFIVTYDTVLRPSKDKLHEIIEENKMMLDKLNELIEAMLSIDMSVKDIDLTSIDDYLASVKNLTGQK